MSVKSYTVWSTPVKNRTLWYTMPGNSNQVIVNEWCANFAKDIVLLPCYAGYVLFVSAWIPLMGLAFLLCGCAAIILYVLLPRFLPESVYAKNHKDHVEFRKLLPGATAELDGVRVYVTRAPDGPSSNSSAGYDQHNEGCDGMEACWLKYQDDKLCRLSALVPNTGHTDNTRPTNISALAACFGLKATTDLLPSAAAAPDTPEAPPVTTKANARAPTLNKDGTPRKTRTPAASSVPVLTAFDVSGSGKGKEVERETLGELVDTPDMIDLMRSLGCKRDTEWKQLKSCTSLEKCLQTMCYCPGKPACTCEVPVLVPVTIREWYPERGEVKLTFDDNIAHAVNRSHAVFGEAAERAPTVSVLCLAGHFKVQPSKPMGRPAGKHSAIGHKRPATNAESEPKKRGRPPKKAKVRLF